MLAAPLFDPVSTCPAFEGFLIGRTMVEGVGALNKEWAERLRGVDEIWVPSAHSLEVVAGAVPDVPVFVVPEPVITDWFDPEVVRPVDLASLMRAPMMALEDEKRRFAFLSVFKWEERKAWPTLLEAFLSEFRSEFAGGAAPVLYLVTQPFHSDDRFEEHIAEHLLLKNITLPFALSELNRHIRVLKTGLPDGVLRSVYRSVDAFVLASRGEGWGRPHCEAASMGLPVIYTNFSGPTAFLDSEVGYPVDFKLVDAPAEGPFAGLRWADPSLPSLQQAMRSVFASPEEATERGRRARERMVEKFSPGAVAEIIRNRLSEITMTKTYRDIQATLLKEKDEI